MGQFLQWDYFLFQIINTRWSNPLMDALFPIWRNPYFWLPLYVFILAFFVFNYGKKAYWILLFTLLTVMTSDSFNSQLVKKSIQRLRPCNNEFVEVISRVQCGSGFSFASTHAANHFALAAFWSMTFGQVMPSIRRWLWLWAASIAFAQVYVGVHFPSDVFVGALMGFIIGYLYALVFNKYYSNYFLENTMPKQ
ncbi:MAG: phosphatase PAP2 family protein [Lewinellaceae bacterium]|nr:phosphatase PAP2 family protein [Lewinellaceae bacterium]